MNCEPQMALDFSPRRRSNPNSVSALKVAAPRFNNVSDRIVEVLQRHGDMTCEEVAKAMGKYPNQISGRFAPLEAEGRIVKVGTRNTHTKCEADVWRAL